MLVGHFAAGLLAKRVEPKLSLGTLVLASMVADFLWCIFAIAGIEHIKFKPGRGAANYADFYDTAWSHSLLTNVVWGALFAGAYFWLRRYKRGALVLFLIVLSHWLLDFVAHRPDMSLAPGTNRFFGLGLWTSIPLTIIVEGGFWLLAVVLYVRATTPKSRLGIYAFWIVCALLTLAWYNNIAGPPPPDAGAAAISSLVFFSLVVLWAYWMNRLRPAKIKLS
jgi:hypothetical protein